MGVRRLFGGWDVLFKRGKCVEGGFVKGVEGRMGFGKWVFLFLVGVEVVYAEFGYLF